MCEENDILSEYISSIISTGNLALKDCKCHLLGSSFDSLAMDRLKADAIFQFFMKNVISQPGWYRIIAQRESVIAKLFKGPQDLFSTEKVMIVSDVWEKTWLLAKLFLEVCSADAARSDPEIIYCKERGEWEGRGRRRKRGQKGRGREGSLLSTDDWLGRNHLHF